MEGTKEESRLAKKALSGWLKKSGGHSAHWLKEAARFELHGRRYYCFRYKRSLFAKEWLLGVSGGYRGKTPEDCGHTGGGAPYRPDTVLPDAIRMVNARREYWMRHARGIEDSESGPSPEIQQILQLLSPGSGRHSFLGSVLLSRPEFDMKELCNKLSQDWGWPASCAHIQHAGSAAFDYQGMLAAVTLSPEPVPEGEAEQYAVNNFHWDGAMKAARSHTAHLQIAVMGTDGALETARVFSQLCASCLTQQSVCAICTAGAVFQPEFYREEAMLLKEEEYPVRDWIYFGVTGGQKGRRAYTYGLENFGLPEMEILDSSWKREELEDFLCEVARHALRSGRPFHTGEAAGFCQNERFPILRSPGVSVDGMSLKIDVGE